MAYLQGNGRPLEDNRPVKHVIRRARTLKVKEGKEDVEVLGKTHKCEWYETTRTTADGEVVTRKRWIAAEVPGGIVKEVTVTKKGNQVIAETMTTVLQK
jgi:hypothetical protein